MHLSILIETMRREGYELSVSTPRVLTKEIDGVLCEPVERLVADVPGDAVGAVMQSMGQRKGEMISMHPIGNRPDSRKVLLQDVNFFPILHGTLENPVIL